MELDYGMLGFAAASGINMGLAAVVFWKKDFAEKETEKEKEVVIVIWHLVLVAASRSSPASSCLLVSLTVVPHLVHLAWLRDVVKRNWRMFLFVTSLWACHNMMMMRMSWAALFATTLQLLREPANVKMMLRDWRVATGPVYCIAAVAAFAHSARQPGGLCQCLRVIVASLGILAVLLAAVALRPDNRALDNKVLDLLKFYKLERWKEEYVTRKAMRHGILMVASVSLLFLFALADGDDLCAGGFGLLLSMEIGRRLSQRRPWGAAAAPRRRAPGEEAVVVNRSRTAGGQEQERAWWRNACAVAAVALSSG